MMMKPFANNLVAATLATLSFHQLGPFRGVDAFAQVDVEVECLTEAPDICVGEKVTILKHFMPNDDCVVNEHCVHELGGEYSFTWFFVDVEGVEDKESLSSSIEMEDFETGFFIYINFDYEEGTCDIDTGSGRCSACSICTNFPDEDGSVNRSTMEETTVAYDCTNLENGKSSGDQCEAVANPFFYPFVIPTNQTIGDDISEDDSLNTTLGLDYEEDENLVGSTAEDPLNVDPSASSIAPTSWSSGSTSNGQDGAVQDFTVVAPDDMESFTAFLSAAGVGVTRGIFSRTFTLVLGFAVFNLSL